MRKPAITVLVLLSTFGLGYAFRSITLPKNNPETPLRKVTGIGGIFFKCKDPIKLKQWYQQHLGLNTDKYGTVFEWRQGGDTLRKGFTQWSPFKETTTYFAPSTKDFMINYRVADMDGLLKELRKAGVTITDTVQTVEYGKFVHILDLEGNKIELWEPNDEEYEKLGKLLGSQTTK